MEEETLDIAQSTDLRITARARSLMRGVGTWCGVTAIAGFIITLGGVFLFVMMFNEFNRYNGIREDEILGLLLMFVGIALMALLSRFLWLYRTKLRRSIKHNSDVHLEDALRGLRNALIMIAIVFILAAGLLLLIGAMYIYFNIR